MLDKRLRVAFFDAIERIEIYIRSIIAHEMGRQSRLAYNEEKFIDIKYIEYNKPGKRSRWELWQEKHSKLLKESKLDCICWYRNIDRLIPIWVAVEAWDFGLLSKYYSMLKGKYKNVITKRISSILIPRQLENWLNIINIIRNKCAHHTRLWNINIDNNILFPCTAPFDSLDWSNSKGKSRLFGIITIIWYLVKQIGSNSKWIESVAKIIDDLPDLPSCTKETMGFPLESLPTLEQFILT